MINPMLEAKVNRNKIASTLTPNTMKDIPQIITGHNHLSYHQHRIGKTELNTSYLYARYLWSRAKCASAEGGK